MSTSRCPIVRPASPPYGARGFVTDYHSFDGTSMRAVCRHCGQTRKACQTPEHDRFWGEDMAAAAGRAPAHERFDAQRAPRAWHNVMRAMAQGRATA